VGHYSPLMGLLYLTLLIGKIQLCLTVRVIHKNSLLLNRHNGDDAPEDRNESQGYFFFQKVGPEENSLAEVLDLN
jgi:hypothetical protein